MALFNKFCIVDTTIHNDIFKIIPMQREIYKDFKQTKSLFDLFDRLHTIYVCMIYILNPRKN